MITTLGSQEASPQPEPEAEVRSLYGRLLEQWNQRNASGYAGLFSDECLVIGFDGSEMVTRSQIAEQLGRIFAHHKTPAYVAKVRSVRLLHPHLAVLHAVVGMVAAGRSDLKPDVNAVQVLIAVKQERHWRVSVFQNTPAAYHGQPEKSAQLSRELQQQIAQAPSA